MECLLCSYFRLCEPVKHVRQVLRLTDLINCFEVFDKLVDCLLPSLCELPSDVAQSTNTTKTAILLKKDLQPSVMVDLGEFIFKVNRKYLFVFGPCLILYLQYLLSSRNSYQEIESLLKDSGIDSQHLLVNHILLRNTVRTCT